MANITLIAVSDLSCENPVLMKDQLPLGITYIGCVLRDAGFDVSLLTTSDYRRCGDKYAILRMTIEAVEKTHPDIVGVSSYTFQMPFVAEFVKSYKLRNPDTILIIGGYNATCLPEETLNLIPEADFLVRGEGEEGMLELCSALFRDTTPINTVRGISFIREGKIVHTSARPQIEKLDNLPIIDFDLFGKKIKNNSFSFRLTRGCYYDCSYCSPKVMWPHVRHFSIEHIEKQISHLVDLYGISYLSLTDDSLSRTPFIFDFAEMMSTKFPEIKWTTQERIDSISRDKFSVLKKSGLSSVILGIESVSPKSLRFMNRTEDPYSYIQNIPKALDTLKELDIFSSCSFISGTPYDTMKDLIYLRDYVLKLIDKYEIDVNHYCLTVLPGSFLWEKYVKGELEIRYMGDIDETFYFSSKYKSYLYMSPNHYSMVKFNLTDDDYYRFVNELNIDICNKLDKQKLRFRLNQNRPRFNKDGFDVN